MLKPTRRQRQVLNFLKSYQCRHQRPPTRREIGTRFKIHINGVTRHLDALEKKGAIVREPHKARAIRIFPTG